MDSFGFAGMAVPCCEGTRRCARLRNYPVWVSVPTEDVIKLRYRDLFRMKGGKIVVQDVLGNRKLLRVICPAYLLHSVKPE